MTTDDLLKIIAAAAIAAFFAILVPLINRRISERWSTTDDLMGAIGRKVNAFERLALRLLLPGCISFAVAVAVLLESSTKPLTGRDVVLAMVAAMCVPTAVTFYFLDRMLRRPASHSGAS